MSDFDQELSSTLHRQADTVPGTPLTFDDVRGRATSIRRRRRLAAGVGVAAALAVIVPTAMFATSGTNADGPPVATQTPTVTDTNTPAPTSTPVMGSDPHALDVRDLPTGAPPAVAYVPSQDGVLSFATTRDANVRWTLDGVVVEALDQVFGPYPSSSGLARNAAGTTVAWATDDGYVMAWVDGEDEPYQLGKPGLASLRVAAVTGTDCLRGKASDCAYYVSGWDMAKDQPASVMISGDGGSGAVDPGRAILEVNDADESGRVLGLTELKIDGSCSEVLEGAQTLLGSCDYTFDRFSPDGSYVLASEAYHDGDSSGVIAVFATAGDRLSYRVRSGQDMAGYRQAVWEDDTHILFTAYQDGMWSIVRMDVHGAMEYAVPPTKGGDILSPPYVLETR
jgi:hypothetical protein